MALSITSAKLSDSGRRKLNFFTKQALYKAAGTLVNSVDYIKGKIVRFAPTKEDEAFQLCYPGIPKDNFIKEEEKFLYLVDAIKTEKIVVSLKKKTIAEAQFGNVARISPKIGFAWHHGKGEETREIRTTRDGGALWQNLLAVWEFGGSLISIIPRDAGDTMTFYSMVEGKRITIKEVSKQIPAHPYEMYSMGGSESMDELRKRVKRDLKILASEIFK